MTLTVVPLNPYVGAEVRGIDLRKPIDGETKHALYQAWLKHLVLLFRDQELSQESLIEATKVFGQQAISNRKADLVPAGWARLLPGIMLISNIRENGVPIGNLPDGEMWFHHDMLHVALPHKGTCLYSMEVPSKGGNTRFASCYRAYETLPEKLKVALEGKRAKVSIIADCRYVGQGHEIRIAIPARSLKPADGKTLKAIFEKSYGAIYGLTIPGQAAEAITWSVTASGPAASLAKSGKAKGSGTTKPLRKLKLFDAKLGKEVQAPVHWRFDLKRNTKIKGPAIIAEHETSTIVGAGFTAHVDGFGNIILEQKP